MSANPYLIPDDGTFRNISFSGGRSSGFMLWNILNAHDGKLPENTSVIFANTGLEVEPTLEFVRDCETHWDVPITWVEYWHDKQAKGGRKDQKIKHKVVTFETASRKAEPFEQLIKKSRITPFPRGRRCTSDLKVNAAKHFIQRDLGVKKFKSILGIRHDEPKRWGKALFEECDTEYPLVHDRVSKALVNAFWSNYTFDLGLDPDGDEGNCNLCFMKGRKKLIRLIKNRPEQAEWWMRMEEETGYTFKKDISYRTLYEFAVNQVDWLDDLEEDDEEFNCFCGD